VCGFIDGEETPFDFNRLIPMPPELGRAIADYGTAFDVYYGNAERVLEYASVKNLKIETVEQLREHFDATPLHRAIANQYKANIEKYGVPTWYEWSCENWNTKWNACDAELTENRDGSIQFNFDTAWSFAYPIFEKLVADFQMLDFEGRHRSRTWECSLFLWGATASSPATMTAELVKRQLRYIRSSMRAQS
jgi:hypothetical protein